MSKRCREEETNQSPKDLLKALLRAVSIASGDSDDSSSTESTVSEEKNESNKCKPEVTSNVQDPFKRRAALISSTTLSQREVIFRAVLDINEEVLLELLKKTIQESDKLSDSAAADMYDKQLSTMRSINWIVVSELAKMCGILSNTANEAATLVHVCSVIREEITRLRSPRLVFQLLQTMAKQVDDGLKEKQVDVLIGSLYSSMQFTFSFVKKLLQQKKEMTILKSAEKEKKSDDCSDTIIRRPAQLAAIFGTASTSGKRQRHCDMYQPKDIVAGVETISPRTRTHINAPSFF